MNAEVLDRTVSSLGFGNYDGGSDEPPNPPSPDFSPEEDEYGKMADRIVEVVTDQLNHYKLHRWELEQMWYGLDAQGDLKNNLSELRRAVIRRYRAFPADRKKELASLPEIPPFRSPVTDYIFSTLVSADTAPSRIFNALGVTREESYELEPKPLIEAVLRGKI